MPTLTSHHTFHLPANCKAVCHFTTPDEFLLNWRESACSYLLGGGSNTLFLSDFDGTVFINGMRGIEVQTTEDAYRLRVAGGENWHNLVTHCLDNGWYGLENLALIPGSAGAAPIQNIGAYGLEVGRYIESVEYIDITTGEQNTLSNDECEFGYRDSVFKRRLSGNVLITYVNFRLPVDNELIVSYGELATLKDPTPESIYNKVIEVRKAKLPDPDLLGNAGSFFKNPVITAARYEQIKKAYGEVPGFAAESGKKVPAAWLIDQCGFKGRETGGVRCHPTQPLVLTNTGNASGEDVIKMAGDIISAVDKKFDIQLEPEVRLVGKSGVITL